MPQRVFLTLGSGDVEHVRVKPGLVHFEVRCIDLPHEFVEVWKAMGTERKCVHYDVTDENGVFEFVDRVNTLSRFRYDIVVDGRRYASIEVEPVIIDTETIVSQVIDFLVHVLRRL